MIKNEVLQKVVDKIEARYGDLDNDCGAYVSTDNGYEWLSVSKIVSIIKSVDSQLK